MTSTSSEISANIQDDGSINNVQNTNPGDKVGALVADRAEWTDIRFLGSVDWNLPCMVTFHDSSRLDRNRCRECAQLNEKICSMPDIISGPPQKVHLQRDSTCDVKLTCNVTGMDRCLSDKLTEFASNLVAEDGVMGPEMHRSDLYFVHMKDVEFPEICIGLCRRGFSLRCMILNMGTSSMHLEGTLGAKSDIAFSRAPFKPMDTIYCLTYFDLNVKLSDMPGTSHCLLLWAPEGGAFLKHAESPLCGVEYTCLTSGSSF